MGPDEARTLRAGCLVLDVRDEIAFATGHLAGSGNVPLAALSSRRAELPPRELPILIVGRDGTEAARGAATLARMRFAQVSWLDASVGELEQGRADHGPPARLWRPAPFLEEVLPQLPRGRAADLAAGSGREAVFLALHDCAVEAWDVAPEALERASALAHRSGVELTPVCCDLEQPVPPLPKARYDLVVCFRFLWRPLFPAIEHALVPGGHLVYETYRIGQERWGRPRRRTFLLGSGELRAAFPALEVLRYEEPEPPGGPITARLVARKPADRA